MGRCTSCSQPAPAPMRSLFLILVCCFFIYFPASACRSARWRAISRSSPGSTKRSMKRRCLRAEVSVCARARSLALRCLRAEVSASVFGVCLETLSANIMPELPPQPLNPEL